MYNQNYPKFEFIKPFAWNGDRTIPTNERQVNGRANMEEGFPPENGLPVETGGVPPHRTDLNGILYQLSTYAYYQQLGGLFEYNETKDYYPPAVIAHENNYYYCIQENGPIHGVHIPGDIANDKENYWVQIASIEEVNKVLDKFKDALKEEVELYIDNILKVELNQIKTSITNLDNQITNLDTQMSNMNNIISTMNNQIQNINNQLQTTNTQINNINNQIANIPHATHDTYGTVKIVTG